MVRKGDKGKREKEEADMGLSEVLFAQGDAESHSAPTFHLPGLQASM